MKALKILGILLWLTLPAFGQMKPVKFTCLLINDDESVLLNWYPQYGNVDFARYEVYHSVNKTSPYIKIADVNNIAAVSYLHTAGVSGNQTAHYFIKTVAFTGSSINSDTLSAMMLVAASQQQRTNVLSWNSIKDPLPVTARPFYHIFRKYGNSSWVLIDSTQNTQFKDSIYTCLPTSYRIVLMDSACQSSSTVAPVPRDIIQPASPVLDSVSVAQNGTVILGWTSSSAPDLAGYYVFHYINNIWDTLANIQDPQATTFTELTLAALNNPLQYAVASYDHCGNTSGDLGIPQTQKTIYLETPQANVCNDKVNLSWTEYINLPSGISTYDVYIRENNDEFQLKAQLPGTITSFSHTNLEHNVLYSYFIRVRGNDGVHTASSPIQSFKVVKPGLPGYFYIPSVTVEENRYVKIKLYPDSLTSITKFDLMRAENASGTYSLIKSFLPPAKVLSFNDSTAVVNRKHYFYQFYVYDSCGNLSVFSNLINTILLQSSKDDVTLLEWNFLKGFDAETESYEVYRKEGDSLILLDILSPDVLQYRDPELSSGTIEETRYYQIAAVENNGNQYGFKEKSWSNVLAIEPEFRLFFPNAFTPARDNNQIFKPISIAYSESNFYMAIFNRFGQKIFETTDFNQGWDGKHKGNLVHSGPYAYYVRILSKKGKYYEKTGLVILLD